MYKKAEEDLSMVDMFNEMDRPDFRIKKIQYITHIGKILRKFSIDEFPQLFNVFAGHMSLAGPRPPSTEEVELYEPWPETEVIHAT